MSDKKNIEELFRDKFSGFESDPGAGSWNAIQSRIPSPAAGTGLGSGLFSAKILTIVSVVSVVAGLGIGYLIGGGDSATTKETDTEIAAKTDQVVGATIDSPEEENILSSTVVIEEPVSMDAPEGPKQKVVIKEVPEPGSIAQSWLTPSDRKKPFVAKGSEPVATSSNEKQNPAATQISSEEKKTNWVETKVDESLPVAVIGTSLTGGPAPLYVDFKSVYAAQQYEWNFGDGKTSKEVSPVHKFEEPGNYQVTLVVKDAKGNSSTDQVTIQVKEGSVLNLPNVISPNNDGYNDVFTCQECKNIASIYLVVSDRSGNTIYFETTDTNFAWDGRDRSGKTVADGIYIVQFKAYDTYGKEYKKVFSLTVKQ